MTGKQLRNSILQWTIQGKLVPQDPNDEPASVLLERIREEKARLVKEKKIKKDKNESVIYRGEDNSYYEKMADGTVRCIDSEIPFDIPDSWQWCRLRNVIRNITDGTHSTPHYTDRGIPFLSVKDISSGMIDFSAAKFIPKEEHDTLTARCKPEKGDLLLSKVGTTGIPVIIDTDSEFSIFVSIALIKFFPQYLLPDFFVLQINSPLVQEQARLNTRGVGNKNWVLKAIADTLVVLPPVAEQHRILPKYKELTALVEGYEKRTESLDFINHNLKENLKRSILQEAIQGRLVPQIGSEGTAEELLAEIRTEKMRLVKAGKLKKSALANESRIFRGEDNRYYEQIGNNTVDITEQIPFDIPDTWEWCRLSCVVNLLSGRDLEPDNYNDEERGIPYMTGASNFLDEKLLLNRWTEQPTTVSGMGDLLITCKGTIGQMAFNNIGDVHIARQIMSIKSYKLDLTYIKLFLEANVSILLKQAKSMIPGISRDVLLNAIFPLPPIAEQYRITERVSALFQLLK